MVLYAVGCKSRPAAKNVLLITIDTLRADKLGCYGSKTVETPNMDALAAAGVLFEEALSPVPITLPSHASILTGLYPAEHGVRDNGFYRLPDGYPNLASVLSSNGYSTAAFVSSHTLNHIFGLDNGFSLYDDISSGESIGTSGDRVERPAGEVTDSAVRWLSSKMEKPFFMWVHYFDPHSPYIPPAPYSEKYRNRPYDGEVAYTDSELGRLIDALKQKGVYDNTLVILTADHGEGLDEHGEKSHGLFLYQSTLRVPLIIKGYGVPEGKRLAMIASITDITPTVLGYLDIKADFNPSGRNLWPYIRGDAPPEQRPLYLETESPANMMGWTPLKGIRTAEYKFIKGSEEELYNIKNDSRELNNIALAEPAVTARMRKELKKIEAGFKADNRRKGTEYTPDADMRRNLKSLGYIGEKTTRRTHVKTPQEKRVILGLYYRIEAGRLRNDCTTTIELGREAINLDPDNPRILEMVASCLHTVGKPEESAALYERLLAIEPRLIIPWTDLASARLDSGEYEEGRKAIKKALKLDPNFHHAWSILGLIEEKDGNIEQAVANYRKGIELYPDNSLALYKLGKILLKNPQTAGEGRKMVDKAVAIEAKRGRIPQ